MCLILRGLQKSEGKHNTKNNKRIQFLLEANAIGWVGHWHGKFGNPYRLLLSCCHVLLQQESTVVVVSAEMVVITS